MAAAIGIDLGLRTCRLAGLRGGNPVRLGQPVEVWRALGLPEIHGLDWPVKAKAGQTSPEDIHQAGMSVRWSELAARLFTSLREMAVRELNEPVEGCVVGIPSQAGNLQREGLARAITAAGFQKYKLISEPTAVALSQVKRTDSERPVLVYSLGAGSLDVSVAMRGPVSFITLASGQAERLRGQMLTNVMALMLYNQILQHGVGDLRTNPAALDQIQVVAESTKLRLTSNDRVELSLNGIDPSGVLRFSVTRADFEERIQPYLSEGIELCTRLVSEAHLRPADLAEVWLAGGSTAIPLVQQMVNEWCGHPVSRADEYAVAFGAALQTPGLLPATRTLLPTPEPRPEPVPQPTPPQVDIPAVGWVVEAEKLLDTGDYNEALVQLARLNEYVARQRASVYFQMGKQREQAADYAQARFYYEWALSFDYNNATYREALQTIERQQARMSYARGQVAEQQGNIDVAIKEFRAAQKLDEENRDVRRALGRSLIHAAYDEIRQGDQLWDQMNMIEQQRAQLARHLNRVTQAQMNTLEQERNKLNSLRMSRFSHAFEELDEALNYLYDDPLRETLDQYVAALESRVLPAARSKQPLFQRMQNLKDFFDSRKPSRRR